MRKHKENMRRANTLVLAVGILVLLAIIATSYVAATHSTRITATSQLYAAMRGDGVQLFADSIGDEIAGSLFVRPVDPVAPMDSSFPRLRTPPDAPRYLGDQTDVLDNTTGLPVPGPTGPGDGQPDYLFNTPAYVTVPWTNWPDPSSAPGDPNIWPINEDHPGTFPFGGLNLFPLAGEGNPPGGPGYGDSRWLADTEPMRLALGPGPDDIMGSADDVVVFTHWRHLTNLARPNNGWRACFDTYNVFLDQNNDGIYEFPNVVTDLAVPHEQWLAPVPQHTTMFSPITGDAIFDLNDADGDTHADPLNLWWNWLSWNGYAGAYANTNGGSLAQVPLNFYNLRDLDGDGILLEPGERPMDEFVGPSAQWPLGTPRWNVGRMLADTDGDGFTDAMWFLAPAGVDRSIRQIVAVRIVDNSAMLNVNLATRFAPNNQNNLIDTLSYRTKGVTPVDLALVGSLEGFDLPLNLPDWPGFFDNPDHWFAAPIIAVPGAPQFNALYDDDNPGDNTFDPEKLWERHLRETGLLSWSSSRPDLVVSNQGEDFFLDEIVRHDYWLGTGQSMLASDSQHPHTNRSFTPYGIADELELRMFHGNNNPWTYSRLERVTQPSSQDSDNGILHGGAGQNTAGSSEFLGKLLNADLVRDSRRKVTTYSGARNDVMPPWLWPSLTIRYWDVDSPLDGIQPDERRQFEADVRKYDLRRSFYLPDGSFDEDVDGDGVIEPPGGGFDAALDDDINNDNFVNILDHHARLQRHLEGVLLDVLKRDPLTGDPMRIESYFGTGIWADVKQSTRAAASLAANILAYRDGDPDGSGPLVDEPLPAPDAVIWADPQVPYIAAQKNGYIGLEAQPFLVEAFIGHVYRYEKEAEYDHITFGDPQILKGDLIVCADSPQGTIVAVQIANPFDVPVQMGAFALRVFGAEMPFNNAALPGLNTPLLPGRARCYYAMVDDDAVSASKWIQALQLIATPSVEVVDVTAASGAWKTSRGTYDAASANDAVELVRYIGDGTGAPPGAPVVVDRMDIRPGLFGEPSIPTFGEQIADADSNMPPPSGSCFEPAPPPDPADVWPDVFNLCHNNPVAGQPRVCDTHVVYMSWACRPWQIDLDNNGTIDDDERNPRFVFANRYVQQLYRATFNEGDSPDVWFADEVAAGFIEPPAFNLLDKGADLNDEDDPSVPVGTFRENMDFPMQMLQKDGDFEQVGELYNLWLFGHELEYGQGPVAAYQQKTLSTFSEFMWEELENLPSGADRSRVNRLRVTPVGALNPILGQPQVNFGNPQYDTLYPLDPAHGTPKLTAGARALEAFVCDGPGALPWPDDVDVDGNSDGIDVELRSLRMAGGFSGRGTPGLINIETATPEVMQSIPGWTRLIHEGATSGPNPYVHMAQAVARYRDRLGDPTMARDPVTGLYDALPSYVDRGIKPPPPYSSPGFYPGLRQSRGFAAIGELMFLLRSGKWGKADSAAGVKYDQSQNPDLPNILFNSSFRADYPMVPERDVFAAEMGAVPAGAYLFPVPSGLTGVSARVSTDVVHGFDPGPSALPGDDFNVADDTAADAEEGNLLVAGASNLVTTRSDVFTVYFKVRSFRQNPVTGRWDATDPEMIVDDSRYVMLVDRTEVNRPGDKPRIVYLEKLPQ